MYKRQVNDRQVDIAVMGISLRSVCLLYTSELGNGFVNDRQVDIAVMGISL